MLSLRVGLNFQDFSHGLVGECVTIRNPVGDGMVNESDNSTTASERTLAPDASIVCELFEGRVHAEFGQGS